MKKSILATIIAATFLAGCSSSGSKNNTPEPTVGIADVLYDEELNSAAVVGDNGKTALIIGDGYGNAAITIDGQVYTVQGDVIVNDQGDIIGTVTTENGVAVATINGTVYTVSVDSGRLIVDSKGIPGQGPEWEGSHPIEGVPEHPIAGIPVNPIEGEPTNPIEGVPEHPIAGIPVNPIEGVPTPAIEASISELTAQQKVDLREQVKSLSTEQRQQIKQAVKTRVQTGS